MSNAKQMICRILLLITFFLFIHDPVNASSLEKAGPAPGDTWIDPVTEMEFVWVPEGCFKMGSNKGDPDEKPIHEVCIDGFWMGKTEVTIGQWRSIMDSDPSKFKLGDNHPVETVSWNDTKEFIKKLNEKTGKRFSLPTEAQWEYAARSGGKDKTYSGDDDIDLVAWYGSNGDKTTHSVAGKAPNGFGIYDMTGNVSEWCEDVYSDNAYRKHSKNNPVLISGSQFRVLRGGAWRHNSRDCRVTSRRWLVPSNRLYSCGFRLVLFSDQ